MRAMFRAPLLALLLAAPTPPPAAAPPNPTAPLAGAEARSELLGRMARSPNLAGRIELASSAFMGTPYVLGPLGEGPGHPPDEDPLVRWDAVDCVTFVEESLALALAHGPATIDPLLQRLRYRGEKQSYAERNHYMEAAWVPFNMGKGYLRDITAEVGGHTTRHDDRTVTAEQWHQRTEGKELDLPDSLAPIGRFELAVVPLDAVESREGSIPDGALLLVAHTSGPLQPNRISHVGFTFRREGRVYVRHASSKLKAVIEDSLAEFVAKNRKYKEWPVSGFTFFEVMDPNAHRTAVEPSAPTAPVEPAAPKPTGKGKDKAQDKGKAKSAGTPAGHGKATAPAQPR